MTAEEFRKANGVYIDFTGEDILSLIYASNVDMDKVLLNAKELFTTGVAMVEGVTKLNKLLMDQMTLDDFEKMTGEYIANFIASSA